MSIASGCAVRGGAGATSYSIESPSSSSRLALAVSPLTRTVPFRMAAATSDRDAPVRRATATSTRLPISSGVTARDKGRKEQQRDPYGDAGVGHVKDVWPNSIEVDEVDDVSVVKTIDDVADRAADDHTERDAYQPRTRGSVAKAIPKQHENDDRHSDEQHGVAAEQSERAVKVALVRPLEKVWNDDPALSGKKRIDDEMLGILIEPQNADRDRGDDERIDESDIKFSVVEQTGKTILRR